MSSERRKAAEEYPQCARWALEIKRRTIIQSFLEWLWDGPDGAGHPELDGARIQLSDADGNPVPWTHDETIMRHMGIDRRELDRERRAMLEAQRRLNLEG